MKWIRSGSLCLCTFALGLAMSAVAYGQAAAPAASPPSRADAELKDAAAKAPSTADLQKGDPGGTLTGTINDVPPADPKAGVTVPDVANMGGQN
ncbi:MAG: hypothetical protein ACRD2S_00880, partial [Terriglobales bacterium]